MEKDFTTTITVPVSPQRAFELVSEVENWWSENKKGKSGKLGDEFEVQFKEVHYSKHKLIESTPGEKIVWLVTDGKLSWPTDKQEWIGTRNQFEFIPNGDSTDVRFTHIGLSPALECYENCFKGWTYYIEKSLYSLLTTGKGMPDPKA